MPNPLAISVTLGGMLLDIVVPRPKPRAGPVPDGARAVWRTPQHEWGYEGQDASLVAGGSPLTPM